MSSHPIKRQAIMKHINADNQPDVVKQFLLSLDIHAGSIVEVGGRTMHISEHDPVLIASLQETYNSRHAGRPLDDVAASIRPRSQAPPGNALPSGLCPPPLISTNSLRG